MSIINLKNDEREPFGIRMNSLCPMALGRAMAMLLLLLGASLQPLSLAQAAGPEPLAAIETVNINRADASALASGLRGVGPSKAEEIVRYREAFGPFQSVDELAEVKGIGKSTLEKNRDLITLE